MTTFNIELNVPQELADNYEYLHSLQKHIMYQIKHYNEYTDTATTFGEEISVSSFDREDD
jgi:hypothetical protein